METTEPKKRKRAVKPVDNFKNKHNATVKVTSTYNSELANPGYVWYVWTFKFKMKTWLKPQKGQRNIKYKVETCTRQGGLQIEKKFEAEHGEHNVKRMIIQNIVNNQQAK